MVTSIVQFAVITGGFFYQIPQIPTDSQCLRGHLHLVLQVHAYHPDPRRRSRCQEHGGHDPRAEAQVEDGGTGPGARLGRRKGEKHLGKTWKIHDKINLMISWGKLGKSTWTNVT